MQIILYFSYVHIFGQAETEMGGKEGKEKCGEKDGVIKNIGGGKVKMNLTAQWETGYYRPFR